MKLLGFLFMLALFGCASPGGVDRKAASLEEKYSDLDLQKSDVQIFPAIASEDGLWYYFYVQLKDKNGKYMDCDFSDITLKTTTGKLLTFKTEKLVPGRFYLTLEKTSGLDSSQIDFFVGGKPLKERFKLHQRIPDKAHTKIVVTGTERNRLILQLKLVDKTNRPVEVLDKPEIIMEGEGSVEDLKKLKEGLWEFSLNYPDENQIIYLSVRAQGVYLQNVFRYQHVEK